jgi:hypothetical protein
MRGEVEGREEGRGERGEGRREERSGARGEPSRRERARAHARAQSLARLGHSEYGAARRAARRRRTPPRRRRPCGPLRRGARMPAVRRGGGHLQCLGWRQRLGLVGVGGGGGLAEIGEEGVGLGLVQRFGELQWSRNECHWEAYGNSDLTRYRLTGGGK